MPRRPELVHRALGFGDRELGRLQRHPADREQARGVRGAELGDPVVVRADAVGDELDVLERGDRVDRTEEHRLRRVQHRGVDAVAVELRDPRVRVVAARGTCIPALRSANSSGVMPTASAIWSCSSRPPPRTWPPA